MITDKAIELLLNYCDAQDNATAVLRNGLKQLQKQTNKQETQQPQTPEIKEDVFNALNWKPETGQKLGPYEVALIHDNNETDWKNTYNFLKDHAATISNRYHCKDYLYSYWIYEKSEYKIYRQQLRESSK